MASSGRTKKTKDGRYIFEHNGRTVYEWEQSLEEVNIYIKPPEGTRKAHLAIEIANDIVRVGLVGSEAPFLEEKPGGAVNVSESYWMLDDGEININLQKGFKGEMWEAALLGAHTIKVDPLTAEEEKKKLMKERFQAEHPGFDFSDAEFNGEVPVARDFMGGIRHT